MASRAGVCHGGDAVLLVLTFGMTLLTYGSGRTNILLGAVHLLLFCTYIALILER